MKLKMFMKKLMRRSTQNVFNNDKKMTGLLMMVKVLQRKKFQYYDCCIFLDGAGYVEDGREVFDDDLDDENIALATKSMKHKGKKSMTKGIPGKHSNIKNMLINMPTKSKEVCQFQKITQVSFKFTLTTERSKDPG